MSLNAYINEFNNQRTLNEKCSVCKKIFKGDFFTIAPDENTRAYIKQNRMCSKKCMNTISLKINKEKYGKTFDEYSDSDV